MTAAAGGVGFLSGLALGSLMTGGGGNNYYYMGSGWTDNAGIYHDPGYYAPDGTYYCSASQIGYSGEMTSYCSNSRGHIFTSLLLLVSICCCCCCCCCVGLYMRKSKSQFHGSSSSASSSYSSSDVYGQAMPQGDYECMTVHGHVIPQADAAGFLMALEAEYVNNVPGAVGTFFDNQHVLENVQEALNVEEELVRNSGDPVQAIRELARRWHLSGLIQC